MKLEDLSHDTQELTKIASETGRKLAFAAAAVVWAFQIKEVHSPRALLLTMVFIFIYVLFELSQSLVTISGINGYIKTKEKEKSLDETSIGFPKKVIDQNYTFFYLKFLVLIAVYLCLGYEFLLRFVTVAHG